MYGSYSIYLKEECDFISIGLRLTKSPFRFSHHVGIVSMSGPYMEALVEVPLHPDNLPENRYGGWTYHRFEYPIVQHLNALTTELCLLFIDVLLEASFGCPLSCVY